MDALSGLNYRSCGKTLQLACEFSDSSVFWIDYQVRVIGH